jgi:serine/threonine protein phosphatase PrpC
MNYSWATATHVGHVRAGNEDSVHPDTDGSGEGPLLIAVADGMGGHVAGEIASRVAIEAASAEPADVLTPGERVGAANDAVIQAVRDDASLAGMGTTLTLGIFDEDGTLHIGHVGDSRIYLLRDGYITQVTTDHTLVNEMVARGQLTPLQAQTHPRRHLLTRVIGMADVDAEEIERQLQPGDRVLLCSDGLTTMIPDYQIAEILHTSASPTEAAWSLVEAANSAGGMDNTTVAVVDVAT